MARIPLASRGRIESRSGRFCAAACLVLGLAVAAAAPFGPDGGTARAQGSDTAPEAGQAGSKSRARAETAEARRSGNERNLVGHGGPVKSVILNADGSRALTGSFDYSMAYWDLSSVPPKMITRFDDHDAAVNAMRFLPGGTRALSGSDDSHLRLWDLKTGEFVHRFEGHSAKIVDVAVSPDGTMAATASWDRTIRLWDLETFEPGPALEGHEGPVNAVAFGDAGEDGEAPPLYSASTDGTVRLWDTREGAARRIVYDHGWGINCMVALPGAGRLAFGALNGAAGVIDVETGELAKEMERHEEPVLTLTALAEENLFATGSAGGVIKVWNMEDWSVEEMHQNPYGPIWGLAFTRDGERMYYSGLDDFVSYWQIRPRSAFETVESQFPRRFQAKENMSLGERQFARKCSICHTLTPDGANRAGPTLYGIFGRKAGEVSGYVYSPALENSDIVWNEETIGELFNQGPQHVVPGTKMPLQEIDDAEKRDALVAYLKTATAVRKEDGAPDGDGAASKSKEQ